MSGAKIDPPEAAGESAGVQSRTETGQYGFKGESESPHDLKATPLRER